MNHTPQRVSVIGAGAWGTTLARHLALTGASVRLWAYEQDVVDTIRNERENTLFLPGIPLPPSLTATVSLSEAVADSVFTIFAVPSHAARAVLQRMVTSIPPQHPIIIATKGIEEDSLKLMTQVMEEVLPNTLHAGLTVLSGPSFALEVCRGTPTATVLAGKALETVRHLQYALLTPLFRVYAGSDLIGVQLGGALKNVMAIAAGVVDGLQLGHNARAALITRGLAEMVRLGVAMGADPRTFYGLSGVGDLVLTCTGPLSRNYTVGLRLGQGHKLADILKDSHAVAEGVRTSRAAAGLASRFNVEMPIVREVSGVLFEGTSPRQAVTHLMERAAKEEG